MSENSYTGKVYPVRSRNIIWVITINTYQMHSCFINSQKNLFILQFIIDLQVGWECERKTRPERPQNHQQRAAARTV